MTKRQKLFNKAFKGKTVKSIDAFAINSVTFFFTDGTSVDLDTENVGYGIYGVVVGTYTKADTRG